MAPRIPIFSMFGPQPLDALQRHMQMVNKCAQQLSPFFFEGVLSQDWVNAEQHYKQISKLENKADKIKKELRMELPKDLFLPVPRSDILSILVLQDRIANKARDIAGLILGRQMQIPDVIQTSFQHLLKRSLDAISKATEAIDELEDLQEAGFSGKEKQVVIHKITELGQIEHETDEIQITIRRKVFKIETELKPIDAIFLYKIIEWTGELADRAHTVGGQFEVLLAHS